MSAKALQQAGADLIIFESLETLDDVRAVAVLAPQLEIPYIASFALDSEARSINGDCAFEDLLSGLMNRYSDVKMQ